jgi:AraC-like DNA-binding protein
MRTAVEGFKQIFQAMPEQCVLKFHGCYRGPVYPDWKADTQKNQDLHILYVTEGEGCYYMEDGQKIPLSRGTMVFISHSVKHHASVNADNPLKIFGFRFGLYNFSGQDMTKVYADYFYHFINISENLLYTNIATKIHRLFHSKKDKESANMCTAFLYQFLYTLYEDLINPKPEKKIDLKIEQAVHILEEHPYEKISIDELAQKLDISTRYLQKLFKSSYGYTPKEYHMKIQMSAAYSMIKEDNLLISQVSERLGYCDMFSFSKQFKKYFGYSPVELKNK